MWMVNNVINASRYMYQDTRSCVSGDSGQESRVTQVCYLHGPLTRRFQTLVSL